jgi:hypothetical protein
VEIYVRAVEEVLREKGMKLNLPTKLVEKLVWVPLISFCKIPFPVMHLMANYAETGRPNRLTLQIILLKHGLRILQRWLATLRPASTIIRPLCSRS